MIFRIIYIIIAAIIIFAAVAACGAEDKKAAQDGLTDVTGISADGTKAGSENANKIENGDFSNGTDSWSLYLEGGSANLETAEEGFAKIEISNVGNVAWGVQLYQDGISLTNGNVYRLSFEAKSDVPRQAFLRIQLNASPYTGYMEETLNLGPEISGYDLAFTMNHGSDPAGRLVINLGTDQITGEKPSPESHSVTIGNFLLVLMEGDEGTFIYEDYMDIPLIHVNQVGYSPNGVKKAILVTEDSSFEICDTSTGTVVYSGTATDFMVSLSAGESVRVADFSSFSDAGEYFVRNAEGKSYKFSIKEEPYDGLMRAILDFYEYQKCGVAAGSGIWSYDACHTAPATVWGTTEKRDVSGGWHDAGDYGRYIVPSAKAVTDLLLAYELTDAVHNDILDIVRYQLEWMLKMQDPETGGVHHKVTAERFCGNIMPHEDTDPQYIFPISPTATGGFAASLGFASRVYRDSDPVFASKLLDAAEMAWRWLDSDRFHTAFKNPDGVVTGEYGDLTSLDERLWAACELYSATGKPEYHEYVLGVTMNERVKSGLGWAAMGSHAGIAYLLMPETATEPAMRDAMQNNILDECERLMELYSEEPYMVSLGMDYPWGSNMQVANNAVLLMFGSRLNHEAAYRETAIEHVHYLLGRNALSQSYVTGFGSQSPMHPHHRPSEAAGAPVPGMVAGGPNGNLEDPYVATWLRGYPPAKCYADSEQSYATNEVTIYWNSPVYLLLALVREQG